MEDLIKIKTQKTGYEWTLKSREHNPKGKIKNKNKNVGDSGNELGSGD